MVHAYPTPKPAQALLLWRLLLVPPRPAAGNRQNVANLASLFLGVGLGWLWRLISTIDDHRVFTMLSFAISLGYVYQASSRVNSACSGLRRQRRCTAYGDSKRLLESGHSQPCASAAGSSLPSFICGARRAALLHGLWAAGDHRILHRPAAALCDAGRYERRFLPSSCSRQPCRCCCCLPMTGC